MSHNLDDHYRNRFERQLQQSYFYQAQLFHAWRVIRQQGKALQRAARKIKRLKEGAK